MVLFCGVHQSDCRYDSVALEGQDNFYHAVGRWRIGSGGGGPSWRWRRRRKNEGRETQTREVSHLRGHWWGPTGTGTKRGKSWVPGAESTIKGERNGRFKCFILLLCMLTPSPATFCTNSSVLRWLVCVCADMRANVFLMLSPAYCFLFMKSKERAQFPH